jgi:hypothetical protein
MKEDILNLNHQSMKNLSLFRIQINCLLEKLLLSPFFLVIFLILAMPRVQGAYDSDFQQRVITGVVSD